MQASAEQPFSTSRGIAATVSVCGKCGYCVRGVASLTCPECGSDLREVGILPPNHRRRLGRPGRFIVWTIALAIAAVLLSILMFQTVLPFSQTAKISRTIYLKAPYLNVTFQVFGTQRLWQPRLMHYPPIHPDSLSLWDSQHRSSIQVNTATGAYYYFTNGGGGTQVSRPGGLDKTAMANWLAVAGANPGDPRVLDLCRQAILAGNEISAGTSNQFTPFLDRSGTQIGIADPSFWITVHDEPSTVIVCILCVFWIAVWLLGAKRFRGPISVNSKSSRVFTV